MRKKHVKKFLEAHGKNFFSEIAGTPHKRGIGFKNPETKVRAIETRKRNRELKKEQDEVQTNDNL